MPDLTQLYNSQILNWADAFHKQWGRWPQATDGRIPQSVSSTWLAVDMALRKGRRGLRPGSSLAKLLAQHRGVRNIKSLPKLSVEAIIAWADAFHRRWKRWPTRKDGPIPGTADSWSSIQTALDMGLRGLKPGSSLAKALEKRRGVRNRKHLPKLTEKIVVAWADAYQRRTGKFPAKESGLIPGTNGDTWMGIDAALSCGQRGLSGGSSLPDLLARWRGLRNKKRLPKLSKRQIIRWARMHRRRTGRCPSALSGPVMEAPGETWCGIQQALAKGRRGLPGGSSIAKIRQSALAEAGGKN